MKRRAISFLIMACVGQSIADFATDCEDLYGAGRFAEALPVCDQAVKDNPRDAFLPKIVSAIQAKINASKSMGINPVATDVSASQRNLQDEVQVENEPEEKISNRITVRRSQEITSEGGEQSNQNMDQLTKFLAQMGDRRQEIDACVAAMGNFLNKENIPSRLSRLKLEEYKIEPENDREVRLFWGVKSEPEKERLSEMSLQIQKWKSVCLDRVINPDNTWNNYFLSRFRTSFESKNWILSENRISYKYPSFKNVWINGVLVETILEPHESIFRLDNGNSDDYYSSDEDEGYWDQEENHLNDNGHYRSSRNTTVIKILNTSAKGQFVDGDGLIKVLFANVVMGSPRLGRVLDPRDGQAYSTVSFGSMNWMAQNLAYLPKVYGKGDTSSDSPRYYVYEYQGNQVNSAKANVNFKKYGALYNWAAATEICPEGWHLPSAEEWAALEDYVGRNNSSKLKSRSLWDQSYSGSDDFGFGALPGGYLSRYSFDNLGSGAYWWTASESESEQYALNLSLGYYGNSLSKNQEYKYTAYSVRCVQD